MITIRYTACLSRGDNQYHMGRYKTYGGARRCIRRQLGMYRPKSQQYDGWAIQREEMIMAFERPSGFYFGMNSCIIAQSRDWKFNLTVIRREGAA